MIKRTRKNKKRKQKSTALLLTIDGRSRKASPTKHRQAAAADLSFFTFIHFNNYKKIKFIIN